MPEMRNKESKKSKAAQDLANLSEVRDGVAVLNDGTMRATLLVSSINFALKSEDEQNAIIYAFQGFLNSLDFPLQISVMSRKLDIAPYLGELRQRKERQQNELLRLQMNEYIDFVAALVKGSDIMTKQFMVTVPFSLAQSRRTGFMEKLSAGVKGAAGKPSELAEADFDHFKRQLLQRVEQVAVGLRSIGLRVAPLKTQEVLELYYNALNPQTSRNQRLRNVAYIDAEDTHPSKMGSQETHEQPWANR